MRLPAHLSLLLLMPATVYAYETKVTAEEMSEEYVIAAATRKVPKGATVIATSCTSQHVAISTSYICTIKYSDLPDAVKATAAQSAIRCSLKRRVVHYPPNKFLQLCSQVNSQQYDENI